MGVIFNHKKNKNIEMRIYELLGVKFWKKMVMGFMYLVALPLTIGMSKEGRRKFIHGAFTNYTMGKINSLEDIKKFKKMLLLNASIHIYALFKILPDFLKVVGGTMSLSTSIINLTCVGLNFYCIMLQRYNYIRINQVIKMRMPQYEKKKNKLKDELRKDDALFEEHTYKIVNKKKKETSINFEDLIANATYNQLIQYREYLTHFCNINQKMKENEVCSDEPQRDIIIPIEKHKSLKLEIKRRQQ